MKITLARALKYQNRVRQYLVKVETDVRSFNSIVEGAEREVDVAARMEQRAQLERHLIELKLKMDAANEEIKQDLIRNQELKARVTFLRDIPTQHGLQIRHARYGLEPEKVTYDAVIRKQDVDKMVADAEQELDEIQERLDHHNNVTTIDIDVLPLRD